jgi:hypothetical protein
MKCKKTPSNTPIADYFVSLIFSLTVDSWQLTVGS